MVGLAVYPKLRLDIDQCHELVEEVGKWEHEQMNDEGGILWYHDVNDRLGFD